MRACCACSRFMEFWEGLQASLQLRLKGFQGIGSWVIRVLHQTMCLLRTAAVFSG